MEHNNNRVLILANQNEKMENTVRFLSRRGWITEMKTDYRSGVSAIVQDTPDYIFVSIQMAGSQLLVLQKLVKSRPNAVLILFSEIATLESANRLMSVGAEHIVYPSAGGPAFDRCLKRIILESKDTPEETKRAEKTTNQDETYWPYGATARVRVSSTISILSESLKAGLHHVCSSEPLKMQKTVKLSKVSKLACLEIRSQSFSGYIVAARASNQELTEEFMSQIRGFIQEALVKIGENIRESEIFKTEISEVNFKQWMTEHAQCFQTALFQGEEVGVGFFEDVKLHTEQFTNPNEHMVGVLVTDVSGLSKAIVDLYLYLPANDRFVRYTRRGESISLKQQDKLVQRNITHLYFHHSDLQPWKQHRLCTFLNQKVELYNMKQSVSMAA